VALGGSATRVHGGVLLGCVGGVVWWGSLVGLYV